MALFTWNSKYSLGVPQIDGEHQRLFEIANQLHAAMLHGTAKEEERKALASLIAYTKAHFTHEEEVMIRHKYPDFQKHKAEHDAFTLKVVELQRDYENGRTSLSIAIMHFLKNWLAHHIC